VSYTLINNWSKFSLSFSYNSSVWFTMALLRLEKAMLDEDVCECGEGIE